LRQADERAILAGLEPFAACPELWRNAVEPQLRVCFVQGAVTVIVHAVARFVARCAGRHGAMGAAIGGADRFGLSATCALTDTTGASHCFEAVVYDAVTVIVDGIAALGKGIGRGCIASEAAFTVADHHALAEAGSLTGATDLTFSQPFVDTAVTIIVRLVAPLVGDLARTPFAVDAVLASVGTDILTGTSSHFAVCTVGQAGVGHRWRRIHDACVGDRRGVDEDTLLLDADGPAGAQAAAGERHRGLLCRGRFASQWADEERQNEKSGEAPKGHHVWAP